MADLPVKQLSLHPRRFLLPRSVYVARVVAKRAARSSAPASSQPCIRAIATKKKTLKQPETEKLLQPPFVNRVANQNSNPNFLFLHKISRNFLKPLYQFFLFSLRLALNCRGNNESIKGGFAGETNLCLNLSCDKLYAFARSELKAEGYTASDVLAEQAFKRCFLPIHLVCCWLLINAEYKFCTV